MGFLGRLFGGFETTPRIEPALPAIADRGEEVSATITLEDFGHHRDVIWPGASTEHMPVVTDKTVLRIMTVFAAVNIIAQDMATFPILVERELGDGTVERLRDHPLNELLNSVCAPGIPAMVMREQVLWRLLLRGNAYAFPERGPRGDIAAIWPVEGSVSISEFGRERFYDFIDPDRMHRRVGFGDLVHIRTRADDGIVGMSPIQIAAQGFAVPLAEQDFMARTIGKRSPVRGLLEAEQGAFKPDEQKERELADRVRQQFDDPQTNGFPFLTHGIKFKEIGISPADAELLEQRKFSRAEIAAVFRMPPSKLAIADGVQKSTSGDQDREYVRGCLGYWARLVERCAETVLLTRSERDQGIRLRHDFGALIEASLPDLYSALVTAVGGPVLTADEARERLGKPAISGGDRLNPSPHGERKNQKEGPDA